MAEPGRAEILSFARSLYPILVDSTPPRGQNHSRDLSTKFDSVREVGMESVSDPLLGDFGPLEFGWFDEHVNRVKFWNALGGSPHSIEYQGYRLHMRLTFYQKLGFKGVVTYSYFIPLVSFCPITLNDWSAVCDTFQCFMIVATIEIISSDHYRP